MGLAVLGLQQSSVWGWGSAATWVCIAAGLAILAAFVRYELRIENPLLRLADLRGPRLRGRQRRSSSC